MTDKTSEPRRLHAMRTALAFRIGAGLQMIENEFGVDEAMSEAHALSNMLADYESIVETMRRDDL